MGYYRGDYYRGDYYRGDPFLGALGSFAARVAPKAAKFVGQAIGLVSPTRRGNAARIRQISRDVLIGTTGYAMGRGSAPVSELEDPGMIPEIQTMPGGAVVFAGKEPTSPKKKNLGGGKVRRTMNPLNPRALKRALRRAEGFEKFAKRTVNALYRVVDGRRTKTFKKQRGR